DAAERKNVLLIRQVGIEVGAARFTVCVDAVATGRLGRTMTGAQCQSCAQPPMSGFHFLTGFPERCYWYGSERCLRLSQRPPLGRAEVGHAAGTRGCWP